MKIYMIAGKARNGKDTIAGYMKDYFEQQGTKTCIMHIGNYIKHFAIDYFGWDGSEETKPRTLLQTLGTEIIREKMNKPKFFTDRLIQDIEVLSNMFEVIIICDVRLPLEFDEVSNVYDNITRIHITRPDLVSNLSKKEQSHITEVALDNYDKYDYKVVNTSLESLKEDAIKIVKESFYEKNDA